MKLTDNVGKLLSNIFLLAIIVSGLIMTLADLKARSIADDWQKVNDQAAELMK